MTEAIRAGFHILSGFNLTVFSNDELAELHRATLDVLNEAGLMVLDNEAREILYSHGCRVNKKDDIVKIPPYLVDEAIASAPSKILLASRNAKHDVVLECNRVAYSNFGTAPRILDLDTGKTRESTNRDLAESAILIDACDCVDVHLQPMTPRDVPYQIADLVAAETAFLNTTKHFTHDELVSADGVKRYYEMCVAVAGGVEEMKRRPVGSVAACAIAPLQLGKETCQVIMESARLGIPCDIVSEPLAGATAPITIAGLLILQQAEVLGGIVLSQCTKKGAPVMYGSTAQPLDMLSANALVGDPEYGMINAALAKIAQYYGIPSYIGGT